MIGTCPGKAHQAQAPSGPYFLKTPYFVVPQAELSIRTVNKGRNLSQLSILDGSLTLHVWINLPEVNKLYP